MENSLSVRPIGLSQRLLSSITSVDKFQMLINTNVCYWICRHWRKRQNTYLFPISTKYCDVWCIIVLLYFSFQCLGKITYEIGKKIVIKLVEKSAKFRSMCENLIVTFFICHSVLNAKTRFPERNFQISKENFHKENSAQKSKSLFFISFSAVRRLIVLQSTLLLSFIIILIIVI